MPQSSASQVSHRHTFLAFRSSFGSSEQSLSFNSPTVSYWLRVRTSLKLLSLSLYRVTGDDRSSTKGTSTTDSCLGQRCGKGSDTHRYGSNVLLRRLQVGHVRVDACRAWNRRTTKLSPFTLAASNAASSSDFAGSDDWGKK